MSRLNYIFIFLILLPQFVVAEIVVLKNSTSFQTINDGALSEDARLWEDDLYKVSRWPENTALEIENYFDDEYVTDNASLIRFDLSSIDFSDISRIKNAKLRLYYKSYSNGPAPESNVNLYICKKKWLPEWVSWATNYSSFNQWGEAGARSSDDRSGLIDSVYFNIESQFGWYEWNVTSAVLSWFEGEDNNGFILDYFPDWGNKRGFASSCSMPPYGEVEWRPELVIEYLSAVDTGCNQYGARVFKSDLNSDCKVDVSDLIVFSESWLYN